MFQGLNVEMLRLWGVLPRLQASAPLEVYLRIQINMFSLLSHQRIPVTAITNHRPLRQLLTNAKSNNERLIPVQDERIGRANTSIRSPIGSFTDLVRD
jgi:hypothetical protein